MSHFEENKNNQNKGNHGGVISNIYLVSTTNNAKNITCDCSRKIKDPGNHNNMKIIGSRNTYEKVK